MNYTVNVHSPRLSCTLVQRSETFILNSVGALRFVWISWLLPLATFLLLTGSLLQIGLQLGQLHTLGGVGWREQAGRVQCHALVVSHVDLSWESVLQLQALQLLGQDCLTAAQVPVRSSDLSGFCRGGTVQVCLRGGAGNQVRDHLMGRILEDSDGGWGRRLAVCSCPIESLGLGNITSINNRCRNIKVSRFLTAAGFSLYCWGLGSECLLPVPPHPVQLGFHCGGAGEWTPADDRAARTEPAPRWVYLAPGETCCWAGWAADGYRSSPGCRLQERDRPSRYHPPQMTRPSLQLSNEIQSLSKAAVSGLTPN